ncbi:MAG: hypothetical protein ACRDRF_00675 [Pseudonocardiaceae bacterium]
MGGLGAPRLRAQSFRAENAKAIPRSGGDPEAIWHIAYDTKTYTDNTTTTLNFFDSTNVGNGFLSNMESAGQFPAPQVFDIHGVFCDAWTALGVSTSATVTGNLNDLMILLYTGTPVWTLTLQQKKYGPYPLISLHGLGGATGFGFSSDGAEIAQYARNDNTPGWNYNGSITIPAQTSFQFNVSWAAAQDTTANWLFRIAMSGKLSRAVK